MSWAKFRTEYKKGFFAEEDMATVMSDAYDECVKTGMGGVLMLPALGNKDGLKTILTACFKSYWISVVLGRSSSRCINCGTRCYYSIYSTRERYFR